MTLTKTGLFTTRFFDFVVPPAEAKMDALTLAGAGVVPIVKVVDLEPCGTTTVAGTCAFALDELRSTMIPSVGGSPSSVKVAVRDDPPVTDEVKVRAFGLARVTNTSADAESSFIFATSVPGVSAATSFA